MAWWRSGVAARRARLPEPVSDWHALRAARAHDAAARVPFVVNGAEVGSVARAHLAGLRAWPQWLQVDDRRVMLRGDPAALQAALSHINVALREQGLIRAWRDEVFPLFDPATLVRLAVMERATARFWGTLTLGTHATGYVADGAGRPTHLWIAQRSTTKATDPGKHDNLIGGGVPEGQTPLQALVREAWEEAGLAPGQMRDVAPGSVLRLQRDIPEGLQHEWLYSYDLRVPPGLVPRNQDGEVAGFACLPLEGALQLASGEAMTVDAALVTLDFVARHRLLSVAVLAELDRRLQPLRVADDIQ
jgi:8-oxo-dGTP pyrophosphatase MutT (NUDIX family)